MARFPAENGRQCELDCHGGKPCEALEGLRMPQRMIPRTSARPGTVAGLIGTVIPYRSRPWHTQHPLSSLTFWSVSRSAPRANATSKLASRVAVLRPLFPGEREARQEFESLDVLTARMGHDFIRQLRGRAVFVPARGRRASHARIACRTTAEIGRAGNARPARNVNCPG